MNKLLLTVSMFALVICCFYTVKTSAQISTKGTDFWVAYMSHSNGIDPPNNDPTPCKMALYITSDVSTSGVVTIPGIAVSIPFSVTANKSTTVDIPQTAYIEDANVVYNKGIHVTAEKPISVFSHIYALNRSGATLVLPENALGKKYYAISYTQNPSGYEFSGNYKVKYLSTIMIVGVEDSTTISITPTLMTRLSPAIIKLNKGQVYELQDNADVSGTAIESIATATATCKKIAVFSGSSGLNIYTTCAGFKDGKDNLYQQLPPVATWGKTFVTAPFALRDVNDIYRVLAQQGNTSVQVNGTNYTITKPGDFIEFNNKTPNYIVADAPVMVTQYQQSQDCSNEGGDPDMVVITPIEQGLNNVTLNATKNFAITSNYLNVIIKSSATSSFKIDGQLPVNVFKTVAGSTYSYLQEKVADGSHTLIADDQFTAIAYGMGVYESYAYSAGGNIQNLQKKVLPTQIINLCQNKDYQLNTIIPFKAAKIRWVIDDIKVRTDDYPDTSISTNNLYTYTFLGNPINFKDAQKHTIRLDITELNSCDPGYQVLYNINMFPEPLIDLKPVTPICADSISSIDLNTYVNVPNGTFTHAAVKNNIFYPQLAGLGIHQIDYNYTNTSGCSISKILKIIVYNLISIYAGDDQTIDLGKKIALNATAKGINVSYSWSPQTGLDNPYILNPIASPKETTTYTLTVSSAGGCSFSDKIKITVNGDLDIPNTFTPNNDNLNDYWNIKRIENYPQTEVSIYNRYGSKIYYSKGLYIPWDGRSNNVPVPTGTYYYVINPNSTKIKQKSGYLTVIY